jgi:hypothetical protein
MWPPDRIAHCPTRNVPEINLGRRIASTSSMFSHYHQTFDSTEDFFHDT